MCSSWEDKYFSLVTIQILRLTPSVVFHLNFPATLPALNSDMWQCKPLRLRCLLFPLQIKNFYQYTKKKIYKFTNLTLYSFIFERSNSLQFLSVFGCSLDAPDSCSLLKHIKIVHPVYYCHLWLVWQRFSDIKSYCLNSTETCSVSITSSSTMLDLIVNFQSSTYPNFHQSFHIPSSCYHFPHLHSRKMYSLVFLLPNWPFLLRLFFWFFILFQTS